MPRKPLDPFTLLHLSKNFRRDARQWQHTENQGRCGRIYSTCFEAKVRQLTLTSIADDLERTARYLVGESKRKVEMARARKAKR